MNFESSESQSFLTSGCGELKRSVRVWRCFFVLLSWRRSSNKSKRHWRNSQLFFLCNERLLDIFKSVERTLKAELWIKHVKMKEPLKATR